MKKVSWIMICIILILSLSSCKIFDSTEETSQYDYLVADIKGYLKEKYGDTLQFEEPIVREGYPYVTLDWHIQYTNEFINKTNVDYSDLYGLTEQIRTSMNEYFEDNPNSPLLKYYLCVIINAPPIYENQPEEIIAMFYNVTCNYIFYQQLVSISYRYYTFEDYTPTSNLLEVNLKMIEDIDTVRFCLENLKDIEIVLVRPEFKNQLANEYPDICFV